MMMMKCVSCKDEYGAIDAGTCRECYEEASETEEELKLEIEELKAKVNFLRFWSPIDSSRPHYYHRSTTPCFTDVLLVAFDEDSGKPIANSVPVPANKAVLISVAYLISILPLPPLFACEKRLFCTLFINTISAIGDQSDIVRVSLTLDEKIPNIKPSALRFYGSCNVTVRHTIQNSPQCHLKFDNCDGVSSQGDNSKTTTDLPCENKVKKTARNAMANWPIRSIARKRLEAFRTHSERPTFITCTYRHPSSRLHYQKLPSLSIC